MNAEISLKYAIAVVLLVIGAVMIVWGVTDTECWWHREDVQVCVATGTGMWTAVAGGLVVGASAAAAMLRFRR
jgi:predicted tellurium resistance membrane protein TerC